MISAIIPHFFKQRIQNLPTILHRLDVSGVDDIIIWNNDDPLPAGAVPSLHGKVRVLQSAKNFGCQGRFMAVRHLLPGTRYVVFQDNDIIPPRRGISKLVEKAKIHPDSIVSAKGELRRTAGGTVVPISYAQLELMPVGIIRRLLQSWRNDKSSTHDDVWLSVQAYKHDIPLGLFESEIKLTHRLRGVGFWKSMPAEQWEAQRNDVFQRLMSGEPIE